MRAYARSGLLALLVAGACSPAAQARPLDAAAGRDAPVRVLIKLDRPAGAAAVRELEAATTAEVHRRFGIVDAVAATVPADELPALARAEGVRAVEPDGPIELFNASAQESFGVARISGDVPGLDGIGLTAAVVDTGIDAGHRELDGDKIKAFANCVSGTCVPAAPLDDNGHGTHVAATLAGDEGVAPGASLVGVKVLDAFGGPAEGGKSRMIAGIEWVIAQRAELGIDVLNLSVGVPVDGPLGEGCSNGQDLLSAAAERAVAAGIVVVAAAGNSGPGPCTIGSPAAAPSVITVGNMADLGDRGLTDGRPVRGFRLSSYSSRGPTLDGRTKPDVVAPGVEITSAEAGTAAGHWDGSGTSAAAPFVAGAALLMLDVTPSLTPTAVKQHITSSAVDWGSPGSDGHYGAGRLDAYAAVRAAGAPVDALPPPALHEHHEASLGAVGEVDSFAIPRADSSAPIAATLIVPGGTASASSPNFDLRLRDPGGAVVASATGIPRAPARGVLPVNGRQEDLGLTPPVPGTYTLEVLAVAGTGGYQLDISRPAVAPAAVTQPTIDGVLRIGETLAGTPGTWAAAPDVKLGYEWETCVAIDDCTAIEGATGTTYVLRPTDLHQRLRFVVTATDPGGATRAASEVAGPATAGAFSAGTPPSVTGTSTVGSTLTAHSGTWAPTPSSSVLRWHRCAPVCSPIPEAALGATYELRAADLGAVVRVQETASADGYDDASAMSLAGDPVRAGSFELEVGATVTGARTVGSTLTAHPGSWSPAPERISWQWVRCSVLCVDITGAEQKTYEVTPADVGAAIRFRETVASPGYADGIDLSPAAAPVEPGTLTVTAAPAVTGTRSVGSVLTAHPGAWSPQPGMSSWQWVRCVPGCTAIASADGTDYRLTPADHGAVVRVRQQVTREGYLSDHALSPPAEPVAAGTFASAARPTVSGAAVIGSTVTAHPGEWSPAPERSAWQWLRCAPTCVEITSADTDRYTVAPADRAATLRVRETVSAVGYEDASSVSFASEAVVVGAFVLQEAPTVTGEMTVGATLAAHEGSWTPVPESSSVEWLRCSPGCSVVGAGSRYTLQAADAGGVVRIRQLVSADGYADGAALSSAGQAVAPGTFALGAGPTVTGTAAVGSSLTAHSAAWTPTPDEASWQWLRCSPECSDIPGAYRGEYRLRPADRGAVVRVRESVSRAGYHDRSAVSPAGEAVAAGGFDNLAPPTVTGVRAVGSTLSAHAGTWAPSPETVRWQWLRCEHECREITGADSPTLLLTAADRGATVRVRQTVTSEGHDAAAAVSAPGAAVAPGAFKALTPPAVSGVQVVGSTLRAAPARWEPAPEQAVFQWLRCSDACVAIPGGDGPAYRLTPADVGASVLVRETVAADGYIDASERSEAGARVTPGRLELLTAPAVSGTAAVGGAMYATPAIWRPRADRPLLQWLRCSRSGEACSPIDGAHGAAYRPRPSDTGATLRVRETAAAPGYDTWDSHSAQTARIARGLRRVGGNGRDVLRGGEGADTLLGAGGADVLEGKGGDDRLRGDAGRDVLRGGAGSDWLDGGGGGDRLAGGPEADRLMGGSGADTIDARGGGVDRVACAAGRDRVRADRRDQVARDCESVRRAP